MTGLCSERINNKHIYLCVMCFFFCESAGFAVTGHVDGAGKSHVFVSEVDPLGLSSRDGKTENGFRFYFEGDPAFLTV